MKELDLPAGGLRCGVFLAGGGFFASSSDASLSDETIRARFPPFPLGVVLAFRAVGWKSFSQTKTKKFFTHILP